MSPKRAARFKGKWVIGLILLSITFFLLKLFVFEIYYVSSSSMYKTLLAGDFILVNKAYKSSLFPNSNGHKNIDRNDIIAFNFPAGSNNDAGKQIVFIKRCIALPGDTILIKDNDIFINSKSLHQPNNITFNYFIEYNGDLDLEKILLKFGLEEGFSLMDEKTFNFTLTENQAALIKNLNIVDTIYKACYYRGVRQDGIFPFHNNLMWNSDNYGPVIIPAKGETITLTQDNLGIYHKIIVKYENNFLDIVNDTLFFINSEQTNEYTFKQNYYFAMGDNRHNSDDSRFWGFVPENHVRGTVTYLLFSIDFQLTFPDNIRKERFFRNTGKN